MERNDTVLIACAAQENRKYLRYVLSERFNLLEAGNLQQMLSLLEQNNDAIVAVVIGTSALPPESYSFLQEEKVEKRLNRQPVVILNEKNDPSLVNVMFERGAADVIDLHYDAYATLHRIDTVAQLHMHRQHLESLIQEYAESMRQSNDTMVDVLSSIIEYRSAESGHHVLRIRNFVKILLEEVMHRCPEYRLTPRLVRIISGASSLHDVGKIAIPDAILTKPGPLTPSEWEIMKTHSATGSQILENLGGMADQEYLTYAKNICRYHHERWDGSGYPDGLVGDQIPICAQVVGLADAYEALTAERSYKSGCTFDQAINMILKGECGAFSPKLLACLKNVTEAYESLTMAYADDLEPENSGVDMTLPLPDESISSLERTQAMYFSLVHYINGFLMEVNLDQELFHVIYNPYPEMTQLEGITKLNQLVDLMLNVIVVPEDRSRMETLLYEGIPRFVEEDLRRITYQFRYRELEKGEGGRFELTLLRNRVPGSRRRSFVVLFRKIEEAAEKHAYTSAWYSLTESAYICRNDQDFTLVSLDRMAPDLGGYTREELFDTYQGHLLQIVYPEDREMVRKEYTRQLRQGTEVRLEHRVIAKNGDVMWVANKSRLVVGEDGQENLHCFLTDITKTRNSFEELRQRYDRYLEILSKTGTALFEWDMTTDFAEFSDSWAQITGTEARQADMRLWLTEAPNFHPDDVPLLMDKITNLENGSEQESQEVRFATDRGRYLWCRIHAHAVRDSRGDLIKIMGVITNIEAEKQKEQLLRDRADRDSLTKLLNKDAGRKKITSYLSNYPNGASCAMLIIDLDDFKQVNDSFGHLFGDAVLSKVAHEIKRQFKGQDIVCRIGGDEFMVLVRGLTDRMLLEERCRRLIGSFCESLKAQHQSFSMSCSIGIALAPEHGKTYHELFRHADQALYRAKAMGKNTYCFYDAAQASPYLAGVSNVSRRIDSDEEPGLAEDNLARYVFQVLHSSDDTRAAINEVISFLGKQMNVSRVYIFENSDDNLHCSNTFEWCNEGVEPQIQVLQNISYQEDIPGYAECLTEQDLLYCSDIRELPKAIHDIVESQGILSMLHCAIRNNGVLRGYIGFDDCVNHRLWTREEISTLTYVTQVLSTFLMKVRRQEKITSQAQDILIILENQNTWIYIIDPETRELRYMNRKAWEFMPQAVLGQPCYRCIMGRDKPCQGCPSLNILEDKTRRVLRREPGSGCLMLFEATLIQWEGREGCMMTSRMLPEVEEGDNCERNQ